MQVKKDSKNQKNWFFFSPSGEDRFNMCKGSLRRPVENSLDTKKRHMGFNNVDTLPYIYESHYGKIVKMYPCNGIEVEIKMMIMN